MRTKALFLTAALGAAGIATSMAQVYSVNAVGYINYNIPGGTAKLVANQLVQTAHTLADLIPVAPGGTQAFFLQADGNYQIGAFLDLGPNPEDKFWDDGTVPFDLGSGLFINVPAGPDLNFTLVGDVPQGPVGTPLTTAIPSGLSIRSSKVPQAGPVDTILGYPPLGGDLISLYNPGTGGYDTSQYFDFGPNPEDKFWDLVPEPKVGEAFVVSTSTARNWVRVFTVN